MTAPDQRTNPLPEELYSDYYEQAPNKFGCTPVRYESGSNWVQYKCRCGEMFWTRTSPSMTRSCRQQGKQCKAAGGPARLDLQGKRFGALEVIRHEKGKGWKVECDCGRTRYILNSTQLANGGYQTCGQCTEEQRRKNTAITEAPPSALRAPVVAAISQQFDNARIVGAAMDAGTLKECSLDHPAILYLTADHVDGCPVCLRSAQIELRSL